MNSLGLIYLDRHRLYAARGTFEEAQAVAQELGDGIWEAIALANLATVHAALEEPHRATDYAHRALEAHQTLERDPSARIDPLLALSRAALTLGQPAEALDRCREALDIAAEVANPVLQGGILLDLAAAQRSAQQFHEALDSHHEAYRLHHALGDQVREACGHDGAGEVLQALGRPAEAAAAHRSAIALLRSFNQPWHLAVALEHLAAALNPTDNPKEAHAARREALALLAEFHDPATEATRKRLTAALP